MYESETLRKLHELKLSKMAEAYRHQATNPEMSVLGFDERFAMLVDAENDQRSENRLRRLIKASNMHTYATLLDIDYTPVRNLDRKVIAVLSECTWIRKGHNLIISGATGAGKSYLSYALGRRACELEYSVKYFRLPRLIQQLKSAKESGKYEKLMKQLKKCDLLIIDDFGLARIDIIESRELLEVIEDRHTIKSAIFISQLPPDAWYETFKDPTFADAIIDRIIHNSYKVEIKGPSMRKKTSTIEEIKT